MVKVRLAILTAFAILGLVFRPGANTAIGGLRSGWPRTVCSRDEPPTRRVPPWLGRAPAISVIPPRAGDAARNNPSIASKGI